jgi:hypothetical protein
MILWELERVESLTTCQRPATLTRKGLIPWCPKAKARSSHSTQVAPILFITPTLPCLLFLKFSWQGVF